MTEAEDRDLQSGSAEVSERAGTRRAELVEHVILRSQVQAAIYELIRGYEETTGLSVVRVDYHRGDRRVTIDALPRG